MKAVEIEDVLVSFRGTPVLEDVGLSLDEGEFLGIIGPNGAGKTVLLQVILGLLEPDQGRVRVFGRPPALSRGEVAYVPQHFDFDRDFPIRVEDVVLMGRLHRGGVLHGFAREDRDRARDAMEELGIGHLADRQVGELSGGQVQRVLVARALAVEARLLILDEPAASLDPKVGVELYERLAALGERNTVILVSHDIGVVTRHVTSIACLNRRLHYHHSREITEEMIEETYGCPVDFVVHEHTHRVLQDHPREEAG